MAFLRRWLGMETPRIPVPVPAPADPPAAAPGPLPGPAPVPAPAPAPLPPLTVPQRLGCDTRDVRLQVAGTGILNTENYLDVFVDANHYLKTREPTEAPQPFSFERDRGHPDVHAYFLVTGTPHNHTCHPEHSVTGHFTWKMHSRSHVRTNDESLQAEFLQPNGDEFYLLAHAHPNHGHRNYVTFHPNEKWPLQLRDVTLQANGNVVRPVEAARFRVAFL